MIRDRGTRVYTILTPLLHSVRCCWAIWCLSSIKDLLTLHHASKRSRLTRNTKNLITPDRVRLYPSDQLLTLCTLDARSNNKSAAFVDLVCDVRADLFTICETWLKYYYSAVLSELTPPGYRTLVHCPRSGRRGGGTALLVKEGIKRRLRFLNGWSVLVLHVCALLLCIDRRIQKIIQ